MKIVAVMFATSVTNPVVRSAQARPIDFITPPIPELAELMPLAKLRFCENHCERIAMLGIMMKPMPQPTRNP